MTVVIAVTSDWHCGSTVALCPPKIMLDDGGEYAASKAQSWLWQSFKQYWEYVEKVCKEHKGAKLYQVFNGDLVDGNHHGTTQILSGNPNAQAAVVTEAMRIPLALKPDKLFFVRGTAAHVGESASAEERIADGLRRDKRPVVSDPDTKTASWWHLRMDVEGVLIDVAHQGRTGQREHTRANAANLHAHDILLAHVKDGDPPPDLCLRAHNHRSNDSGDACSVRVVTTGCWQFGTGWVNQKFADTMPTIGGAIVIVEDGEYEVKKVHYKPSRGSILKFA